MAALSRVFGVAIALCLSSACSHAVSSESGEDAQSEHEAAVGLPPFPEEAVLCRLALTKSTPAEVSAVLGVPDDTRDSGGGSGYSGSFFYDYAAGASLFIGFLHGVFDTAMVDDAPYPSCWSAQERELEVSLRALGSMTMSDQGGAK